jgi:hypothetical protein
MAVKKTAAKKAAAKKTAAKTERRVVSDDPMLDPNIRYLESSVMTLDELKHFHRNPRRGNVRLISESLLAHGQYRPIVIWTHEGGKAKDEPEIIAGNHTYKGAKFLDQVAKGQTPKPDWIEQAERRIGHKVRPWAVMGVVKIDATAEEATAIMLADNRTADSGGYDTEELKQIIGNTPDYFGTGYSEQEWKLVHKATEQAALDALNTIKEMQKAQREGDDVEAIDPDMAKIIPSVDDQYGADVPEVDLSAEVIAEKEAEEADKNEFDDALSTLQGALMLNDEMQFDGASDDFWQIPMLRDDMLIEELPEDFRTWGGRDATPPDEAPDAWWLWNYGACSKTGLPFDRAILCFYTWDEKFEPWWDMPSYHTAKALNAGVRQVVVPDFSFYDYMRRPEMLNSVFRAQWLGRYFQEAGMRVAPRIQFSQTDEEMLAFNKKGIPKGAPVVFCSQQNFNDSAGEAQAVRILQAHIDELQMGTLVIYGGNPAKRVAERLKGCTVKHMMNVAGVRRHVVYGTVDGLAAKKGGSLKKKKRRETADDEEQIDYLDDGDGGDEE